MIPLVWIYLGIYSVNAAVVRTAIRTTNLTENLNLTTQSSVETDSSFTQNLQLESNNETNNDVSLVPVSSSTPTIIDDLTDKDGCLNTSIYNPALDILTQDEFTARLTDGCRYDRLIKPDTGNEPLDVYIQIDMHHVESSDQLQLKAHMMVQLSYQDKRLKYDTVSPDRGNIMGEEPILKRIWVPHIVVKNERDSALMGLDRKDVFIQVDPHGYVIYSYRMTVTFYCWMNLKKFPFDYQICEIRWSSWAYNMSSLRLYWQKHRPFQVAQNLHLTEYVMDTKWTEEAVVPGPFLSGGLTGNYSVAIFKFKLRREVGYYIMDYFLPSILLVCTSWVTFWLQADASAPRVTLGSFEKAKEKLKLLEIQSDVDVTDTESARKKVGVRHLEEYVSDIDSEGEDLPVIKLNNKPIIKPSKPHLYQASKFGLNSLKNTKPILSQPKNNDSQNMCQNEIRTEGPSGSEGSLGISSGLSSSSYERLEELLVVSIKKQEKIERHMEYIIQLLQKFHPDGNLEELREMDIFPLGTPDELINMNDKLLADSNNHEKTVSYLKLLGGKDGPDTTRRILRKIMTNDLSNNINWSGRGGKPAFKEFNGILKVINESVRGNPLCKNTSEKEVESIIKIWLRGSCDRDGGRNLRRN